MYGIGCISSYIKIWLREHCSNYKIVYYDFLKMLCKNVHKLQRRGCKKIIQCQKLSGQGQKRIISKGLPLPTPQLPNVFAEIWFEVVITLVLLRVIHKLRAIMTHLVIEDFIYRNMLSSNQSGLHWVRTRTRRIHSLRNDTVLSYSS